MKYKFLILSGFLFLMSNSCTPEIDNPTSSPVADGKSGDMIIHKLLINGNYIYVNEIKGVYYYAQDITITPTQFNYLKSLSSPDLPMIKRSAIAKAFIKTWPKGIIYYKMPEKSSLSTERYAEFLNNIKKAFEMISSKTKVKFIEGFNQPEYINFKYSESSNDSPVGWTKNTINTINVVSIGSVATIAHEIMHSMGIEHEQSRPDRDKYIIVHTNRIQRGMENNWNIEPEFAGFGTFDFKSVMLYDSNAGSIDSRPVMTKLDGTTFESNEEGLSEGDYAGINHLYNPL
ncbi:M12 family metallopeptidase [Elizabethkingia ursingii]|uniref:M12 family metallopeptidase n=1 Tax=Elizabethkingia ursingii TaxID=1756150 RepID=UPI0009998498|nr:M12 family metallopeptidase [Elizabethkingia ursingii]